MANTTNRIAGTAYLTADGKGYSVAGDFEYDPSSVARETLSGQSGVDGYSEKPKPGEIKATLRDMGGLSLAAINAMTDVTVVVELANGKTIIGRNMWTVEPQGAKAEDATVPVTWQGISVTEN
ncbi:phage tail tube protein [Caballeronia sordidicola]|uniref:Phage tail tube protein n=1 Tax=Caballeronia sordidicola TaxID=196367 RepID=A0A242N7B6_CABSO|nr:phage tail tube protein [Caballeronia sordidicola]OTP79492.1 Phage tail tube protein [Caballeronia sordidicola]